MIQNRKCNVFAENILKLKRYSKKMKKYHLNLNIHDLDPSAMAVL